DPAPAGGGPPAPAPGGVAGGPTCPPPSPPRAHARVVHPTSRRRGGRHGPGVRTPGVRTPGARTMERSERCPLCRQPSTRREYEAIEKRIRKEERARVAASEAKARRELREEHQREIAALTAGQDERLVQQRELLQADHDRALLKVKAEANRENE